MKIVTSSQGGTSQKIPTSTSQMTKLVVVCMANSSNISSGPVIAQVTFHTDSFLSRISVTDAEDCHLLFKDDFHSSGWILHINFYNAKH